MIVYPPRLRLKPSKTTDTRREGESMQITRVQARRGGRKEKVRDNETEGWMKRRMEDLKKGRWERRRDGRGKGGGGQDREGKGRESMSTYR